MGWGLNLLFPLDAEFGLQRSGPLTQDPELSGSSSHVARNEGIRLIVADGFQHTVGELSGFLPGGVPAAGAQGLEPWENSRGTRELRGDQGACTGEPGTESQEAWGRAIRGAVSGGLCAAGPALYSSTLVRHRGGQKRAVTLEADSSLQGQCIRLTGFLSTASRCPRSQGLRAGHTEFTPFFSGLQA